MIRRKNQSGFTLIELLISMAIAGMMLAGMILAFTAQSRTYNTQQDISALQEDMKAALQLMSRDIRMAGYDPKSTAGSRIIAATATTFNASQDLNGNGTLTPVSPPPDPNPEETLLYSFVTPAAGSTASITRKSNAGTAQPVIDNITHLGFQYLVVTPGATPMTMATRKWMFAPASSDLPNIRAVNICIQGRTARQTSTISDTGSFIAAFKTTAEGATDWTLAAATWTPAAPGMYQWRTMCIEVTCRNLQ